MRRIFGSPVFSTRRQKLQVMPAKLFEVTIDLRRVFDVNVVYNAR